MKFELEINDRPRTVEIQRRADGYHVSVDGKPRLVHAVRIGDVRWSLLVRDADSARPEGDGSQPSRGGGRSVEATVVPRNGNSGFDVHVDGFHIPVQLKGGLGRRSRDIGAAGTGAGPQRVVAPMPGKIVRVLVKPGDAVTPRQGLVVVEAMKMENELRAAREGRVREVLVAEGQSVDAGTALVVVE